MSDKTHLSEPRHGQPEHQLEGFDQEINVKAIVWSVIGFVVVIIVSVAAMAGLFSWFRDNRPEVLLSPLEEAREIRTPPGPQLQAYPERELVELRGQDAAALSSFAWADSTRTTARIPIDRAIDLVVEHGLDTVQGWLTASAAAADGPAAAEAGGDPSATEDRR